MHKNGYIERGVDPRMRVGTHKVETRKLAFFIIEELVLFISFIGAAFTVAHLVGLSPNRPLIVGEAAAATLALQVGLYLADLYDVKVALSDAPRAARLTK